MSSKLFAALLKYWRGRRGMSQLDLALRAGVSARHVSYLETSRASPTEAMVRRLLGALDVPLRDVEEALVAAGLGARRVSVGAQSEAVERAIARMLHAQEPFPCIIVSPDADVLRANDAARDLFARFVAQPERIPDRPNMFDMVFDPALQRSFIVNWEQVAQQMLARARREALTRGSDASGAHIDRALSYPGVPKAWRQPDFAVSVDPVFTVRLARDGVAIAFINTITTFSAPQSAAIEELRIESCFPFDEATSAYCEARRVQREASASSRIEPAHARATERAKTPKRR
jgi:transcriptional regulator with XRE-family HTH domain